MEPGLRKAGSVLSTGYDWVLEGNLMGSEIMICVAVPLVEAIKNQHKFDSYHLVPS